MELKRIKPYKARKPEDTIFLIRKILHQKLGILLKEEHYIGDNRFHSCRISIGNLNLEELNIGTNGKGMKFEYALASAYGEFMERLQNQLLILSRSISIIYNNRIDNNTLNLIQGDDLSTKFIYAPDEENIKYNKSMGIIRRYVRSTDVEQLEDLYEGRNLTLVPFVNIVDRSIETLPLNIILSMCTSNGMCAGNTPKEAIIQGMSEILERFIVRKIYYDNISFPNIPFSYFEGTTISKLINEIQNKYEWDFYIKDCSCGMGIPAIGVLIIDRKNLKYLFHIGVDPSPITALERTLTEIYQGKYSLSLKNIDISLQNKLLNDINIKSEEMFKTCTAGCGQFPISLLFEVPKYSFDGFDLSWGRSDENDFSKMLDLFNRLGAKVFIRDVSFLGFPAYHIYVPGMSEFRNIISNSDLETVDLLKRAYPISRNLGDASEDDIKLLLKYISQNDYLAYSNLKFYNTSDIWRRYDKNLILSMLYYTVSQYDNALRHMNLFIDNAKFSDKELRFFTCLKAIMTCLVEGMDKKWISSIFGENYVERCASFLSDKKYLKFLDHANCYKCDSCKIRACCKVKDVLTLTKKLENEYIVNSPNQTELLKILCK